METRKFKLTLHTFLFLTSTFFTTLSSAFLAPHIYHSHASTSIISASRSSTTVTTSLFAAPIGPIALAKKLKDPDEYDRIITQKMKQDNLTRVQAEADYNSYLENPPFYYALDKKEEYYKSLGYKDIFEGMIGEAEKEGKNEEEVRERIESFRRRSQVKAYSVLVGFGAIGVFVRNLYLENPEMFKGGLPDFSIH